MCKINLILFSLPELYRARRYYIKPETVLSYFSRALFFGCLSCGLLFNVNEPDVDVLASRGLPAMNSYAVFPCF